MAANPDDIACMITVCESLAENLTQGAFTQSMQRDTIELLDLIPQILATDSHPARLQSLLFVTPRPLAVLSAFLRLRLAITPELRLFALKTLSQVLNLCTGAEALGHLAPRLKEALLEAMVLEQAVNLTLADVTPAEATAAAEMIFVLVMKLPAMKAELRAVGIERLVDHLWTSDNVELRSYLCAILRTYADKEADIFTASKLNFVANCVDFLVFNESKQCVILMMETLTAALNKFPSLYMAYLQQDMDATKLAQGLEIHLYQNEDSEVIVAAEALVMTVLRLEGDSTGVSEGRQPLLSYFARGEMWQKTFAVNDDGMLNEQRLRLQRYALCNSHTSELIAECEKSFYSIVPSLCAALSPDKSPREIILEAAIVFGTMCAKSPNAREMIHGMVDGYGPWARHLFGTVRHAIERYVSPSGILRNVMLWDYHQTLLNDGAQAQNIDFFNEHRIAAALLSEQTRRKGSEVRPIDQTVLDYYSDHRVPTHVVDLSARLMHALLIAASARALTDADIVSDSPDRSAHLNPAAHMTPRRGQGATYTLEDESTLYSGSPAHSSSKHPRRVSTPSHSNRSSTPVKRAPFRPSSPGTNYGFQPKRFTQVTQASGMKQSADVSAVYQSPARKASHAKKDPDEYLMMAITMHLPITYGVHYNRHTKAAIRHIDGPTGAFVQQVHRNTTHTWSAEDVHNGELYVLFLPYHKITQQKVEDEIRTVERHLSQCRKLLLVTPQTQKGRRWFLHDMLNYILPKTELLLRDFLELVENFGADDIVYQLGVIRLVDEAAREREGTFAVAAAAADVAMPDEILRISGGRFKDVLHSGNIAYAVSRLRQHYEGTKQTANREGSGGASLSFNQSTPSQLVDIDREIQKLERRAAEDVWGQSNEVRDDDVESDYSDSALQQASEVTHPSHYLDDDEETLGSHKPPQNSATPSKAYRSPSAGGRDEAESLPPHMRSRLNEEAGSTAFPPPPTMSDFDSLYAAVEGSS